MGRLGQVAEPAIDDPEPTPINDEAYGWDQIANEPSVIGIAIGMAVHGQSQAVTHVHGNQRSSSQKPTG